MNGRGTAVAVSRFVDGDLPRRAVAWDVRIPLAFALLALTATPGVACTAPDGPEQTILVGVESGGQALWEQDSTLRHRDNMCRPSFHGFPAFDGGHVVWRGTTSSYIANATTGEREAVALQPQWGFDHGRLLEVEMYMHEYDQYGYRLAVRDLADPIANRRTIIEPPPNSDFSMVHGSVAMAWAVGTPPTVHVYDAYREEWVLSNQSLDGPGWPSGPNEVRVLNERWLIGESRPVEGPPTWWAFDIANRTLHASGALARPTPVSSSGPGDAYATNAYPVDLRGDVLFLSHYTGFAGPYTSEEWSVQVPSFEQVGRGYPPPITIDGMTARYRVTGETYRDGIIDSPSGTMDSASDGRTAAPTPAPGGLALMALAAVAIAYARRTRR